jgi:hypothetical protein
MARAEEKRRGPLEIHQLFSGEIAPMRSGLLGASQVTHLDKQCAHKDKTMW